MQAHSWYCYNVLKGEPRADEPVFKDLPNDDTVVWEYDNTKNSQPYEDSWAEKWTETRAASLAIKDSGMRLSPLFARGGSDSAARASVCV